LLINNKLLLKISEKWPVKVLSVAAALIISIFYRMNTLETRFFSVPLQIDTNENLVPSSSISSAVRISLRGEPDGIQQIIEDDIEAFIDLGRYTSEGTYKVPVQIRKKDSALGISPLEISVLPIEIPLVLEQKVRKSIPVFPIFLGSVAQGYELSSQQLIPEMVIAEGPRSIIEDKNSFNTEIIDLDRRYDNFSVRVNIINNDPFITIQGDRMIEYRGTINRIVRDSVSIREEREPSVLSLEPEDEHPEPTEPEDTSESEEDTE
jgi:YbbR domain-containing protein